MTAFGTEVTPAAGPLRYADVAGWLAPQLSALGWDPVLSPGPATDASMQRLDPQAIVFLDVGGGAGPELENLYDRVFIGAHVIGPQGDYAGAEELALALDRLLLALATPAQVGSARVLRVERAGGRPALFTRDNADRYHLSASYLARAAA